MIEDIIITVLLTVIWFIMATVVYPWFVEHKLIGLYKDENKVKEILETPHMHIVNLLKTSVTALIESIVDKKLQEFRTMILEDVNQMISNHLKMFKVTIQREAQEALSDLENELEQQAQNSVDPLTAIQLQGLNHLVEKKPEMASLVSLLLSRQASFSSNGQIGAEGEWR